ncbi:hypothetical protein YPPY54_1860, partial [Yersinia pestis PY-54]
MGDQG